MRTNSELFRGDRPLIAGAAVVLTTLLAVACTKDRDPILPPGPELDGREYYPVAVGQFREYDVVDKYWQYNSDSVVTYQLRERVDTVFTGAGGEVTYRLVRSRRAEQGATWRDDSVMMVVVNKDYVRRTFANRPSVELLFPIREGKSWNPNLLNAPEAGARRYEDLSKAFVLPNGTRFEKTVKTIDAADSSIVALRAQKMAYAWNIGPIYRHRRILDYCNQSDQDQGRCQLGSGYIVRGFEREEQLRDWGPR